MSSVASLSNSFRLGGNEAPPAVMSVFVGRLLSSVLDSIENMSVDEDNPDQLFKEKLNIVNKIPEILPDNTDRNRTSPFAFTGNRFEFRAVGSSMNVASALFILNAAVSQQITAFKKRCDEIMKGGTVKDDAIVEVIREFVIESKKIRFEGNGYAESGRKRREKRIEGYNRCSKSI